MEQLAKKLNINEPADWQKMTKGMLQENGGVSVLAKYSNSVSKLLTTLFPSYQQVIRNVVLQTVHDLKLPNVEQLLHVPPQYPLCTPSTYLL